MSDQVHKVVIIGSGPAGWTAAIYAARANLEPTVFVGVAKQTPSIQLPGGQLMLTTDVENYPGFPEGVSGPQMMQMFQKQAERFGTKTQPRDIVSVEFNQNGPHKLTTDKDETVLAHTVILATGATANWMGQENEMRLATNGGGVSACAVCDGALPMFRDKPLAVVGGGDSAMEEATYLTKFASTVYIIHRRDELRASKVMQERFLSKPNAKVLWNKTVADVLSANDAHGHEVITAVQLKDTQTGELSEVEVGGLFIAIGHTPATGFIKDSGVEFDEKGYVDLKGQTTATNIPGVFAAGDIADSQYRQAITAAGTGCQAALDAEHWLGDRDLI
jgi:thioredoxin reductase (NADPH)